MTSTNHDPPGLHDPNPPDEAYSPSKAQGVLSSVVADDLQDFPTQSKVQWTQPDPLDINIPGLGIVKGLEEFHTAVHYSPMPEHPDGCPRSLQLFAREQSTTPKPKPVVLSIDTTMAFYNATPYVPDTPQTPVPVDMNWDWENAADNDTEPPTPIAPAPNPIPDVAGEVASCMANFLEIVRFQALPANTLYEVSNNLEDLPGSKEELNQTLNDLKLQINDVAQGYASYYPQAKLCLCEDNTLPIGNVELNTALRVLMVAFDAGVMSDTYQSNVKAFTVTSWFQAAHSVMGAILRGAICSPHFRHLGRDSLNGTKDHILISKGLYRPLTHLQLLQAMSEQMQRLCETREELDTSHITNVYNTAVQHVTSELTTLLAAHAYAALSEEDKNEQKHKALEKLDEEMIKLLKANPITRNHTISRVVDKIHDSLYTGDPSQVAGEGRMGIEDWRDLWIHAMRDAMRADQGEEPFPPSINLTNSQITKRFGPQICTEVKARVAKIKAKIIADATSHLISEREAKFMDEIEKQYNAEVAARAAEVYKHKEADIAREVTRLEKQTKEALMESANKVVHFQVAEETKQNRCILEAKEDSDQWKLVLDIVARNKLKVVPIDTITPTVLALDSNPSLQESILSYLDPAPATKEITMLEPTSHKLMDEVDEMAARKGDAGQTAAASIHNPANQMDAEQSTPTPQHTVTTPAAPQDLLTAILVGITNLTTKMDGFESRLMAVEQGETPARAKQTTDPRNRPAPLIPPRPVLKQGPKGILITSMPRTPPKIPPRPQQTKKAEQPLAPKQTPAEPQQATSEVEKTAEGKIARIDDPESFPPLPPAEKPFIIVTKRSVCNQQNALNFAGAVRSAQFTPQPTPRNTCGCTTTQNITRGNNTSTAPANLTTEVTIMRDGGLKDKGAERAIHTLSPEQIVMKACITMEQTAECPPFLLGGRWAGSANTSGNFVYVFNGTVKFTSIAPFGTVLIGPLKRGVMVPVQGWVWTQLRNVPVSDENGVVYDSDKLTAEVRRNAVMACTLLCTPVHWQCPPTAIMGDASATV
ncbi:hypothetical protein V8E53_014536 [Lactarius tabidus]